MPPRTVTLTTLCTARCRAAALLAAAAFASSSAKAPELCHGALSPLTFFWPLVLGKSRIDYYSVGTLVVVGWPFSAE